MLQFCVAYSTRKTRATRLSFAPADRDGVDGPKFPGNLKAALARGLMNSSADPEKQMPRQLKAGQTELNWIGRY